MCGERATKYPFCNVVIRTEPVTVCGDLLHAAVQTAKRNFAIHCVSVHRKCTRR